MYTFDTGNVLPADSSVGRRRHDFSLLWKHAEDADANVDSDTHSSRGSVSRGPEGLATAISELGLERTSLPQSEALAVMNTPQIADLLQFVKKTRDNMLRKHHPDRNGSSRANATTAAIVAASTTIQDWIRDTAGLAQ